jgi:uncharacterized delta-60 repeat protein
MGMIQNQLIWFRNGILIIFRFFRIRNPKSVMKKLLYLFSATFLFSSSAALSQSGSLDSTFSDDGIIVMDIGANVPDILFDIAIQEDQKILAGGHSGGDFVVVRFLPDGTPDLDFGNSGIAKVDFGQSAAYFHGMTIQTDGRIILAGEYSLSNNSDFALARLNTDGSLDSTFGEGGKVITDLGSPSDYANDVVVQSDGKIIAAGKVIFGDIATANFAMIRYESNGEVDTDFGVDGIAITSIRDEDEAQEIVILPDGRIILGGFAAVMATGDYAMVRYLPDGTEDKSFGTGGKVVTDLAGIGNSDFETCMLVDQNGKILLAGAANYNFFGAGSDLGVVRYDSEGNLDPGFGIGGIYILNLGGVEEIQDMVQQPDGKYLLAGKTDAIGVINKWLLVRIVEEGGLDTIFGNHGLVVTNMPGNLNEEAVAIELQKDSRIVMGGFPGDFSQADFTLARYIADFVMTAVITGITCSGTNDAVISMTVSGGVPPYEYSLDGIIFQESPVFTDLAPGDYTLTIKDSNGTGVTGAYGPIQILDAVIPDVVVEVDENTIIISVDGPGPYLYSIDGGGTLQSSNTFPGLTDGAYQVAVVDQNGCLIYNNVALVQATGLETISGISFSISPNPCKDFLTIEVDDQVSSLKAIIVDISGRIIRSEQLNPNGSGILNLNVSQLINGHYTLWLRDGQNWATAPFVKQ